MNCQWDKMIGMELLTVADLVDLLAGGKVFREDDLKGTVSSIWIYQ